MGELNIYPECQIVMTKSAGLSGTFELTKQRYKELHQRYSGSFLEPIFSYEQQFSMEREYRVLDEVSYDAFVEAGYGGIFQALFCLGYKSGLGVLADQKRIEVSQPVIEVSEYFNINPYLLHSRGSMLIACRNGEYMVQQLLRKGVESAVIGRMTRDKARIVIAAGGQERYLTPVRKDELLKCLNKENLKGYLDKNIISRNRL